MLWQIPKNFPILKAHEVHVWRASLARTKEELIEFRSLLNPQEQERAGRFLVPNAANNFIIARGILRRLLANYLHCATQDIIFQQNKYGKLYLDSSPLQFYLSHSRDLSVFIFALDRPVGIDIEFIQEKYDFIDIAKRFFSQAEVDELFSLPQYEQRRAFFNCWTRKEAFIKAKGVGLFYALDKFSVEVIGRVGKVKLKYPADEPDINIPHNKNWSLEAMEPDINYAGALAVGAASYSVDFYLF